MFERIRSQRIVPSIGLLLSLTVAQRALGQAAIKLKQLTLKQEFVVDGTQHSLTAVADIEVSPEGRLFILQPDERTIRVFDPDGRERRIGRQGSGPGEF